MLLPLYSSFNSIYSAFKVGFTTLVFSGNLYTVSPTVILVSSTTNFNVSPFIKVKL